MFHRPGKKAKTAFAKPLKDLIAIITPAQLLADAKRQELLQKIKESSALDNARFDSICLNLINNLANHCQSLPETANSYYALPGGLLDHALNRTEAALNLIRDYMIKEGTDYSEEQSLWIYALFSAAILQGIGKLQIDFRVDIYDVNGQQLKPWNPLLESMPAVGQHYHYEFQQEHEDEFRRRLNLMLARQLMPVSGFAWIASNPQVLAVWLALLNEDWQSAGTLGALLIRADAIAIQRYFSEFMVRHGHARGGRANRISTFVDTGSESIEEIERLLGIEFIQWLMQSLENGKILINKAPLLMVPGGMLMSVDMYKLFVREHPEYKNWQAIQNGFLALGLHQVGADGNVISRFEQNGTKEMHSGVVFSGYAVALPNQMKIHNISNGRITAITATDLVHMAQFNNQFTHQNKAAHASPLSHLSAAGQWQQVDSAAASLQPGTTHGG